MSRARKYKSVIYNFYKHQIDYCYWQIENGLMFFDYASGPRLTQFSSKRGEKMIGYWLDGEDCYNSL